MEQPWQRVGEAIERRISELRLSKAEVLRASGISTKTLDGYIDGQPIRRVDKGRDLCRALRWSPDSIDRILDGKEPIDLIPLRQRYDQAVERYQDAGYWAPGMEMSLDKAAALAELEAAYEALHEAGDRSIKSPALAGVDGEQLHLLERGHASGAATRAGDPIHAILASLDEMKGMLRELLRRDGGEA